MIFYKAKAEDGRMVITGTQADARAVNKQFDQIDIPTDKAGLMAFAQKWADQEFEMNKLLDEMGAELNRLAAVVPEREENEAPAVIDPEIVPSGKTDPHVKASLDFSAEVRRQISVEEEIQNCDLPRLATLASNVAWRYKELSEKCLSLPSDMT